MWREVGEKIERDLVALQNDQEETMYDDLEAERDEALRLIDMLDNYLTPEPQVEILQVLREKINRMVEISKEA